MGIVGADPVPRKVAISLVIPCCNEAESLTTLEAALLPLVTYLDADGAVETILIDDGSTDQTWSMLQELATRVPNVRVLRHRMNYGLGAALRTGLSHARGDIVITTDADGTYPFAEIPDLLRTLTPGIAIVTASPYHPQGGVDGVPHWRLILSKAASQCYRIVLRGQGSTLHTYTSLFRAYRRHTLPSIMPEHEGFLAVAEMLVRGVLAGYTVAEYPTVLHVRRQGQSKARVFRITWSHLRFLIGLVTNRVHARERALSLPAAAIEISGEVAGG